MKRFIPLPVVQDFGKAGAAVGATLAAAAKDQSTPLQSQARAANERLLVTLKSLFHKHRISEPWIQIQCLAFARAGFEKSLIDGASDVPVEPVEQ
ncbi:hypothetical protein VW35_04190 [Devosia soli]|uniref:Uncharacterized protein n=1 Tax=Devosia soli TaxID=361041 RepID=A0A0F5LBR1_9HYPH|nr:hypothetical protein [Devosia soli]KKB79720.1 hypothetical protein VW35_04190 [Devosia soli]